MENNPNKPGYMTANGNYPHIKEFRDKLKKNPTQTEVIMWQYLRGKKTGYKIRRQHIIEDFIVDFVCLTKKVVIEIDGKIHLQQKEEDQIRTTKLNELGFVVIRFTNQEVLDSPQTVTNSIQNFLDNHSIT
jgi:leucyl-tRNA synthetase